MNTSTMTAPSALLTEADMIAITGMPRGTAAYYRHAGIGPKWFKLGRSVRYTRADVDQWIADQYASTGSQR